VITDLGDGLIEVELPAQLLTELTTVLHPRAGLYQLASAPNLAIEITKSRIRDQEGNVIREVG
jgi:hypothetical protein